MFVCLLSLTSRIALSAETVFYCVIIFLLYYLLLKLYPKYKIDRDRNTAHDTDKNIKT